MALRVDESARHRLEQKANQMLTALTDAASRAEVDRCAAATADAKLTKQLDDTTAKLHHGFAHVETVQHTAYHYRCISIRHVNMLTSL